MNIILLQDIDKVGFKHDVVSVKNGYGRNYLIPQGYALIANATNLKKLDSLKQKEEEKVLAMVDEFKAIAAKLDGKVVNVGAKTGTSGKIFGSVTNVQIANALKEQLEVDIDRRKISLEEEIKTVGTYVVNLDLHPEVQAKLNIEVVGE